VRSRLKKSLNAEKRSGYSSSNLFAFAVLSSSFLFPLRLARSARFFARQSVTDALASGSQATEQISGSAGRRGC
jgi:hypothetical protein